MKTDLVNVSETRKNLVVEIPSAVVDTEIDRVTRDYGRAARIPGFRPGKVPARLVRQRFREQILQEVAHDLIPRAIDEILRERGIELPPVDAEAEQAFLLRHEDAREHPCAAAATEYAQGVEAWLEAAGPRLQARGEALERQHRMGLSSVDPEADADRLRDAVEVIQWYQHQIAVKILRAVGTTVQGDVVGDQLDQSDSNGSAKVALLGMDRSVAAWAELLRQMPDDEDRILPLLVTLGRLRRDVEATFPTARAFIRPGFDTGEAATGAPVAGP